MYAAMPTPNTPAIAWVTGRFRMIRMIAITTAAARAAPMPQPRPPIALATMNTTTGRPESTMPIGPPICSQMVGVDRVGRSRAGASGAGIRIGVVAGTRGSDTRAPARS